MRDPTQEMRKRISAFSEEALVEMLETKPRDYTPEALNIAKEEAAKRGGLEEVSTHEPQQEKRREAQPPATGCFAEYRAEARTSNDRRELPLQRIRVS